MSVDAPPQRKRGTQPVRNAEEAAAAWTSTVRALRRRSCAAANGMLGRAHSSRTVSARLGPRRRTAWAAAPHFVATSSRVAWRATTRCAAHLSIDMSMAPEEAAVEHASYDPVPAAIYNLAELYAGQVRVAHAQGAADEGARLAVDMSKMRQAADESAASLLQAERRASDAESRAEAAESTATAAHENLQIARQELSGLKRRREQAVEYTSLLLKCMTGQEVLLADPHAYSTSNPVGDLAGGHNGDAFDAALDDAVDDMTYDEVCRLGVADGGGGYQEADTPHETRQDMDGEAADAGQETGQDEAEHEVRTVLTGLVRADAPAECEQPVMVKLLHLQTVFAMAKAMADTLDSGADVLQRLQEAAMGAPVYGMRGFNASADDVTFDPLTGSFGLKSKCT